MAAAEPQITQRTPMRHTLKKRSKPKSDLQKQQQDHQWQQEKIQQAKTRRQCRSRESVYIKRQKILSANPARNRSMIHQQKVKSGHQETDAKGRMAKEMHLRMNSNGVKADGERFAADEKENRGKPPFE